MENTLEDREYIKRVLEFGNFGGLITIDDYYVHCQYDGFKISLRPEGLAIDFWVTTTYAYVPVSVPVGVTRNAYVSKCIRWVFERLLAEVRATQLGDLI